MNLLTFQIICMGKYSDTREMDLLINPTFWLIHPAVVISIVLNILIYQKQRKIEREDENQRSMFVSFHFGNFVFFSFSSGKLRDFLYDVFRYQGKTGKTEMIKKQTIT